MVRFVVLKRPVVSMENDLFSQSLIQINLKSCRGSFRGEVLGHFEDAGHEAAGSKRDLLEGEGAEKEEGDEPPEYHFRRKD